MRVYSCLSLPFNYFIMGRGGGGGKLDAKNWGGKS